MFALKWDAPSTLRETGALYLANFHATPQEIDNILSNPTTYCVVCKAIYPLEWHVIDCGKFKKQKSCYSGSYTIAYRELRRLRICKPCHERVHSCIDMGVNPFVRCEICSKSTFNRIRYMTFEMCPECYQKELDGQSEIRNVAQVRVKIANELTLISQGLAGLKALEQLTIGDTMAINEAFADEHTAFWNEENKLISDMTMQELDARIDEWEKIYREAKTKLSADREKKRNWIASLSREEREKLLNPNSDPSDSRLVTDSIQAVKKRQERMTLAQKTSESIDALLAPAIAAGTMTAEQAEAYKRSMFSEIKIASDKPARELIDKRPITHTSFLKEPLVPITTNSPGLNGNSDSQKETSVQQASESVVAGKPESKNWFDSSSIKFGS